MEYGFQRLCHCYLLSNRSTRNYCERRKKRFAHQDKLERICLSEPITLASKQNTFCVILFILLPEGHQKAHLFLTILFMCSFQPEKLEITSQQSFRLIVFLQKLQKSKALRKCRTTGVCAAESVHTTVPQNSPTSWQLLPSQNILPSPTHQIQANAEERRLLLPFSALKGLWRRALNIRDEQNALLLAPMGGSQHHSV